MNSLYLENPMMSSLFCSVLKMFLRGQDRCDSCWHVRLFFTTLIANPENLLSYLDEYFAKYKMPAYKSCEAI